MRIIAGKAKGRRLKAPKDRATRPMQDRIKEAVFSSLGSAVAGASVLDLYAGTGSMGLEALSRGASRAVFVERDRKALTVLRDNCAAVDLGGDVVAGDVAPFLASGSEAFDLVFIDPPYPDSDESVLAIMTAVGRRTAPDGLVVLHRPVGATLPETESLVLVDERRYGGAQLWRFKKEST